jgi:RNA polymerase-binding transcription factor DksA
MTQQRAPARPLTPTQLAEIRVELERLRGRYAADDARQQALEEALTRMDDGRYGVCVECNARIPYDRLSVMPETPYCITCRPRL